MSVDLMDLAIDSAQLEHGRIPQRRIAVGSQKAQLPASVISAVKRIGTKRPASREWLPVEDAFLKATLGLLTEEDIASELNRTLIAVHLRWKRDLSLPAPSKDPSVITAHGAAKMLGIDAHKTAYWVDCGLIPGRLMPGKRKIRLIERISFLTWACSPRNWVWFDPKEVQDPHLRRLLKLEAQRWGDEWWSTRQTAEYHGVDTGTIKLQIQIGRFPNAFRLPFSRGGRDLNRKWSNWFVLKSEVEALEIPHGRGRPGISRKFSNAADAWILKARDQLGMTFAEIGRTMKIGKRSYHYRSNPIIGNRYHILKKLAAQKKTGKKTHIQESEGSMASKRHLRRKQCEGKRPFDTVEKAGHEASKRAHITGQFIIAYHCDFCHKYHVGHPPKEVRRALKVQRGISFP